MTSAIKKTDWRTLPFPNSVKELAYKREFPQKQLEKIKLGFEPNVMEEKWFVYFEDNTLNFHRSWTGLKIYEVVFSSAELEGKAIKAFVNNDPSEYVPNNDEYETKMINFLIDSILLEQEVPFPK